MIEKISTRQTIFLLIISRIATILTVMPIIHVGLANQDIWIMIIISLFYSIIINAPLLFLSSRFNNLTIIGCMEKIFGKILGKLLGIFYCLFFLRTITLAFYVAIKMIRTAFMTELSPKISILVLTIVLLYITTRGLEVLLRMAELIGPIIITSLIIFMLLGYNNMDFSILLPIYKDSTFWDINLGGLQTSLIFTDLYILAMNTPQLENKKDLFKIYIKSMIYSLIIILIMVVVTQASLGIEQTRHSNYPFLNFVRIVKTYSIFERIESAFLTTWLLSVIIRITTHIYITSYAFKEIFSSKEVNKFIYIVTIIAAGLTYYFVGINPMLREISKVTFQEYILHFTFRIGIPLIALIIYFFRRKSFQREERLSN